MRRSFAHFPRARHALLAAAFILLAGCATLPPPTTELEQARQALARAQAADADQYASPALEDARAALARAQAALDRGRDEEAREAALEAATRADLARVAAEAAVLRASLAQQRGEIAALRQRLGLVGEPDPIDPLQLPVTGTTLDDRLRVLDADPRLAGFAQYERLQARTALAAVAVANRRTQAAAQQRAALRIEVAEQAARIEAGRRVSGELDRERGELLVEASRRDAEQARAEAERLRMEAQVQAEEAARLREQAQQAEAVLDSARSEQADRVAAARGREAALAREQAELEAGAGLPPMQAGGGGEVFTLGGDAFAAGQATLTAAAKASLSALARYLALMPPGAVTVTGYTDAQGEEAANLALSQRRADAVRAALTAAGVPRGRLQSRGMGEANPVADNATAAGRARNRRVEILVSPTP